MINKTNVSYSLFQIIVLTLVLGCSQNETQSEAQIDFTNTVKFYLRNDGVISEEECNLLNQSIRNNLELNTKYSSQIRFRSFIDSVARIASRNGNLIINTPVKLTCDFTGNAALSNQDRYQSTNNKKLNIYLENSGSVYGYLREDSEFRKTILDLVTIINRYDETINFNLVNDKIYPLTKDKDFSANEDLNEIVENTIPAKLRKIGNVKNSDLAEIFNLILKQQQKDKRLAIIISDFIFSIGDSKDVKKELSIQKNNLTNIIHRYGLNDSGMGFLVISLKSDFNGFYYTYKNSAVNLNDVKRPYHILIVGNVESIKDFPNKYQISELTGYLNHFLLFNSKFIDQPYFSLLRRTNTKGSFDPIDRRAKSIQNIENIDTDRKNDGVLQLCMAVDLVNIPVDESYLLDESNWNISPLGQKLEGFLNGFRVVKVESIEENRVERTDKRYLQTANYLVTFQIDEIPQIKQSLEITLRKKIPDWVNDISTTDDLDIGKSRQKQNKTFGYKDLIEGVWEDFKPLGGENDIYFSLPFTIDR